MPGALYQYLADDHKRLDDCLQRAAASPHELDTTAYAQFRAGLLRHIGIEEKILLPSVQQSLGSKPLPLITQIRLDHAALAALLVPPPTRGIIAAIRAVLTKHNELEENQGGLYEIIERLARDELNTLLEKARSAPEVRALPHNAGPNVLKATRRALARAGYDLSDYESN